MSFKLLLHILCFELFGSICVHCFEIINMQSFAVGNNFYAGFNECFLKSFNLTSTANIISCLTLCIGLPGCQLACLDNNKCNLYSTLVAPYFDPLKMDDSGPPKEKAEGKCLSQWSFKNDITSSARNVAATSHATGAFEAEFGTLNVEKAYNGYHCDEVQKHSYHSDANSNTVHYFQLDFEVQIQVEKVVVIARGLNSWFNNIEVRVGDTSCEPNCPINLFNQNAKLGEWGSVVSEKWEFVTFDDGPLQGRYVTLRKITSDPYITIGEIKVIGKVI